MRFFEKILPFLYVTNAENQRKCSLENALISCTLSNSILQIPEMDCEMIEEIIPSCMKVLRGPPGQNIIRIPFEGCRTEVFINEAGFFSYKNSITYEGEEKSFTCTSEINSRMSFHLIPDGDIEHMANNSRIFDVDLKEDKASFHGYNGARSGYAGALGQPLMEEFTIEVSAKSKSIPSFLTYRVEHCFMMDYSGEKIVGKQIVKDFCPATPLTNSLPDGLVPEIFFYHRLIVEMQVVQLIFRGLPFYETTKIKFMSKKIDKEKIETRCDLRICLRGSDDNLCDTKC